MPEKNMDITERISKIGEMINQYRESVMAHFKDMDVEVKEWHVSVKKIEKEYDIFSFFFQFWINTPSIFGGCNRSKKIADLNLFRSAYRRPHQTSFSDSSKIKP
ncbi:MAG: hypothetical protein ABSF44_13930 [Candidatus Bathyarchaeia archaeon]